MTTLRADTNFFFLFFIQLRNFYSLKKPFDFKVILCGFVQGDDATPYRKPPLLLLLLFFFLKSTTPLHEILFKAHTPLPCLKEDCYLGDAALCPAAKAGPWTPERSEIHWMVDVVGEGPSSSSGEFRESQHTEHSVHT